MNAMNPGNLPLDMQNEYLERMLIEERVKNATLTSALEFATSQRAYAETSEMLRSLRFFGWFFRPKVRKWLKEKYMI